MPFYTYTLNVCLGMYLKAACYLTRATLSPQKSQKHRIYPTAGKNGNLELFRHPRYTWPKWRTHD